MDFNAISPLSRYAKEYGHAKIREAGVTDTEHKISTFLYFHSDVCQDTIANALMLDKTTVAKALVSLEARGLILRSRNPENRRKNTLAITDAGRATIMDVVGICDEWLSRVSACLSSEEQRSFEEYCGRLLAAAKNISEERQS